MTATSSSSTEEVSMSQHFHDRFQTLLNPNEAGSSKVEILQDIQPYLGEVDGYLSFSSDQLSGTNISAKTRGELPVLEWNAQFRKSYTLLLWVRPVLGQEVQTTIHEDDQNAAGHRRVLYRFATSDQDAESTTGVCVTMTDWRVVETDTPSSTSGTVRRMVHTQLFAYSLPHQTPELGGVPAMGRAAHMSASLSTPFVMAPLELEEGVWSLVGISHVNPYLKRPHWTLCVNGRVKASGELAYPVLDRTPIMTHNTLLENSVEGGCTLLPLDLRPDTAKKASELQNQVYARHVLKLHLATFCLANESFTPTVQALLAQAGPNMSLGSNGCLPPLPPVANWSKGSSLEGPNVGIPLVVHGQSLTVQQLAGTCVLWGSAVESRLLGRQYTSEGGSIQRIVCRMPIRRGTTNNIPRVGLIQPTPPDNAAAARSAMDNQGSDDIISLTVLGDCSVHHNLSNYLLNSKHVDNVHTNMLATTQLMSLLLLEGSSLDSYIILPFFLSLPPPGTALHLQMTLLTGSLQHLFQLYANDAEYACFLVRTLTDSIRTGGGRWQEHVLQNGTLHMLASTLRQSLVRAEYLEVDRFDTYSEFVKAQANHSTDPLHASTNKMKATMSSMPVSPSRIPVSIARAVADLLDVCCGPSAPFLEDLDPSNQIQRTSDIALTALFGIGLDWQLWGDDLEAASIVLEALACRYGGSCVTAGYILRSQVSVQFFLDTLLIPLQRQKEGSSPALLRIATACALILKAMLLSSLSNTRSVSQGENDVGACMGALSDCPLGSVGSHVIFTALVGVLQWCDVLPISASSKGEGIFQNDHWYVASPRVEDDHKSQVALRLGRNLLISQFHDVIAPMLLSRTVFSGERTMYLEHGTQLEWEHQWRQGLLIFSWVSTLAGPEGVIAAKSLGSLMLASSFAGSLRGALTGAEKASVQHLFLPPPTMALTIAAFSRSFSEWSYTDLLSDRLKVMMPLLPGLVVSLVAHPSEAASQNIPSSSLKLLAELLTAVGGGFYRVFGGQTHSASPRSQRNQQADSSAVQAAKSYVHHLLVVAMVLEYHIVLRQLVEEETVSVLTAPKMVQRGADDGSWVEVSSTINDSYISDGTVILPEGILEDTPEAVVLSLRACQRRVLATISELMTSAMRAGGGELSTLLWRRVLLTLKESEGYTGKSKGSTSDHTSQNVLCRLAAMVLTKSLKRDYQWEAWPEDLGAGISRLCILIEEKELLARPVSESSSFSKDQVLLLCSLLNVLKYGRDTTGWCQLLLPTPPGPVESDGNGMSGDSAPTSAKVMLPVLQPALRCTMECLGALKTNMKVEIPPSDGSKEGSGNIGLLDFVMAELRPTLMAAIVGMSFANARDIALYAMATSRRAIHSYKILEDEEGLELCNRLMCLVAEEIRVRYEGERRRRETALFDAYPHDPGEIDRTKQAVTDSQIVESMILGSDFIPAKGAGKVTEEVSFDASTGSDLDDGIQQRPTTSDDFVIFNDGLAVGGSGDQKVAKMQWNQYEGLSSALEECSTTSKAAAGPNASAEEPMPAIQPVLDILSPFLDAWDENAAKDAAESELVNLFDFAIQLDQGDEGDVDLTLPLQGSETAADSMSTFIELAAAEKARVTEVENNFLVNHRYSSVAYTERFCWARYNEIIGTLDEIWERGIADGNRDIRSRLVTIPCTPQFRRYIPKYLDHGSVQDDDEHAQRGSRNVESDDIDEFTKTLISTGHLEIVDITKKEVNVEDTPELNLPDATNLDFDDFGEAPMETPSQPDKSEEDSMTGDSTSTTQATAATEETGKSEEVFDKTKLGSSHYNITASAFASPPDNSSSTLSLMHSAAAGLIEKHVENCLHVKAEGSRKCSLLLTATHLILEYDAEEEGLYEGEMMAVREEAERQKLIEDAGGNHNIKDDENAQDSIEKRQREAASLRPKSIRWNLSELSHVYLRRYRLRDSSVEMFFIPSGGTSFGGYGLYSPSTSLFLDFGPGYDGNTRRDEAAFAIMKRAPPQAIKQWPDRSAQFLHEQLSRLTLGWVEGRITNFDYLLHLNMLAGRSYNDTCQYPVMPWVLSNYKDEEIPDLHDPSNFRDLTKPIGALNPDRLEDFIERFSTFADPSIPPFMYGSHYSTNAGVVLHFLVRLHPFAGLHRQLQGGHFDVADRLFSSVPRTWDMCTGSSAAEVKELTPEWYCNPAFLKNVNKFKLGTSQDGELLGDVALPPWAKGSPERFVEVMRNALESDICSGMLPDWIDLIFGRKQQGPEAIKAHNVFFYLTYYGSVDVAAIEDEDLRHATELQIAHFGQCPMQLFVRPHVHRLTSKLNRQRMSFYQVTSAYTHGVGRDVDQDGESGKTEKVISAVFGQPLYLPFYSAPLSHWVHLDAPPPGPHADLISTRLAGTDRCLAVDANGVFHCFRWAWKPEDPQDVDDLTGYAKIQMDSGCFVAQRELPRFRAVPRLVVQPKSNEIPAVAISKTLFAGRTVLLVLSDADGRGGFAMQLVDPAKGSVKGEVVVDSVHACQITSMATDPIGTAAGHGGVGGELAIVGSLDGTASIWRFMSSHYLPLRPRVRLTGHCGSPILAVGLSASINIAATVSEKRLCLHSIGNGSLIRVIEPPKDTLHLPEGTEMVTSFAKTTGVAISVQGFVVTVCETFVPSKERKFITMHLFSLEGVSLGSKPMESWRGVPQKILCTPDGTAVLVCAGRGVSIHRLSAITPLEFIDEWQISETDELDSTVARALDVDLGPSLNRPVIAAAACSDGALRLHALAGISSFSERHKKSGIGQSVGSVFAAPARRLKSAVGKGWGLGSKVAGVGKEIGKEIQSDVKEKGVGGFLGNMFRKGGK
eukprot:Nitzschia sp. Nitz4//scaffold12_size214221//49825//58278//NITZ4_001488-RA/size214221-processed-gene-0.150-mRNA-1//-1//CDS//3329534984//8645//frame0